MKQTITYIAIILLGLYSCIDDKGSYDYTPLETIHIDTLFDTTTEIFDTLRITSNANINGNSNNMEYCWYRYLNNSLVVDTLSTQKDLEYYVQLSVGHYTIFFKATDKNTGISEKSSFDLNVTGRFSSGLMILGTMDNKLSMHFINSAGNVFEIYNSTNSSEIGSNPVQIADASAAYVSSAKDMLILCDDGVGGASIKPSDFSKSKTYSQLFLIKPTAINPQSYYRSVDPYMYGTTADFIIGGGKLYTRRLGTAEMFGDAIGFNPYISGNYDLSPWAVVCGAACLFYDNSNNGRFLCIKGDMMSLATSFSSITSATAGFDASSVGAKALYLAEGAPSGSVKRLFGIFEDNITHKTMLKTFSLKEYSDDWSSASMDLLGDTEVSSSAVGITDASTSYAMSISKPYLFYSNGSKIYQYNLETNNSISVYDVNDVIPGSTIDKLYIEYYPAGDKYGSTSDNYNTVLYVASSESGQTGKNGSLHVLKLNSINGTVESTTNLYKNIFGQVKSMCYKR